MFYGRFFVTAVPQNDRYFLMWKSVVYILKILILVYYTLFAKQTPKLPL